MRKDQLVSALVKKKKNGRNRTAKSTKTNRSREGSAAAAMPKKRTTATQRRIRKLQAQREMMRDLGTEQIDSTNANDDRLVLMVRDSYWLHAYWELSSGSVERAKAALAEHWHNVKPTLRLLRLSNVSEATRTESVVREIEIHGAVNNWYIDVQEPPQSFRVEIGYTTSNDHFFGLARSNCVTTPKSGSPDMIDGNWADVMENSDRIFAMSGGYTENNSGNDELQELLEERLRRPIGSPMVTRFGQGAEAILGHSSDLKFSVDVEVVVYGMASRNAHVTMLEEPVKLGPDGSFTARMGLPNRRQVIPLVATSADGIEEQTIVLGLERNTKVMEPKFREIGE